MFDDLRNSSAFIEEEEPEEEQQQQRQTARRSAARRNQTFLGMTAPQRFFLSLMLFFMVLVLGIAALIATGSIFLPF